MKTPDEVADDYAAKPAGSIFPAAAGQIRKGLCPTCGKAVGEFKNALSEREYEISGMCQACQDSVFS